MNENGTWVYQCNNAFLPIAIKPLYLKASINLSTKSVDKSVY